ncbi:MAG: hypothetical protein DMF82_03900 [Acidobacteria bacterium]|nr:MAG: hypothetical protein DMF82_03900 [Acidobacteriota bacterium]
MGPTLRGKSVAQAGTRKTGLQSPTRRGGGMLRPMRLPATLGALALVWAATGAAAGDGEHRSAARRQSNVYIVRMSEDPAVAYKGGIPGLRATKPARGQKIDPNDARVADYVAYVDSRHDAALVRAGGGRKVYDYRYSFNGFAAELTEQQAAKLATDPGVLSVSRDEMVDMDTSSTPTFLGLDAPGGLWDQLGGVGRAGEDIIIGVVDSGIWPEHPSFSDRGMASAPLARPSTRRCATRS